MRRRPPCVTLPLALELELELELELGFFLTVKSFQSQLMTDGVSNHQKQHHTGHIRDGMLVGLGERNSVADGVIPCHIRPSRIFKVMAK